MKGSIRPYGNRWRAWWDIGPDPVSGLRRRRSKVFATETEARTHLERIARERSLGSVTDSNRAKTRISDFVDRYIAARIDVEESTRVGYESKLRTHIVPRIGRQQLGHITGDLLSALYGQMLDDGVSVATVKHVHRVVHGMFARAVEWKFVSENPATTAILPKYERPDIHVWTRSELVHFLETISDHPWRTGYILSSATGMRRAEVCGLRWDAVDLERGLIEVRSTRVEVDGRIITKAPKSKRGRRVIPIDDTIVAVLRAELLAQKKERLRLGEAWEQSGLVVVRSNGAGVSPNQFTKTFKRLVGEAKLPEVRLHDLRHTWGTLAVADGVDPKTVSLLLGHATVGFTLDTYVGKVDEKQREAAQRMSRIIGLKDVP